MKKIIVSLALVFFVFVSMGQIEANKEKYLKLTASYFVPVDTFDNNASEVFIDSVMLTYSGLPVILNARKYKTFKQWNNDTLIVRLKSFMVLEYYSRHVVVKQRERMYVIQEKQKTDLEKSIDYLRKGKQLGVTDSVFWNHEKLIELRNLPQDSIQ